MQRQELCIGLHVVVGGQLAGFRQLEGFVNTEIREMPLAVGEIFA